MSIGNRIPSRDITLSISHTDTSLTVSGLWSDGTTMWVLVGARLETKIYAYNLSTGAPDPAKDFDTLLAAGNDGPADLWSDGTTMWVGDFWDNKLYAYNLLTKLRDSDKDLDVLVVGAPFGHWSDRTTIWITAPRLIAAYNLATKARVEGPTGVYPQDFTDFDGGVEHEGPANLWSDGTTMWVGNRRPFPQLRAYNLSTKARDPGKDYNSLITASPSSLVPLWGNGTIMWVAGDIDSKIYAYDFLSTSEPPNVPINLMVSVQGDVLDASWLAPVPVTPDPTAVPPVVGYGGATSYDARWRVLGTQEWTTRTGISITSTEIGSLQYDTSYEVQVRSVNAGGMSAYVASVVGRTAPTPVFVPRPPSPLIALSIEVKEYETVAWVDVVDRIGATSKLTEGRVINKLGGELPTSQAASLTVTYTNVDNYFTTGMGKRLISAGSQIRLRWGPGQAITTRFIGTVALHERLYDGVESIKCTYYGELYRITAGSAGQKERLFIAKPPTTMFSDWAAANGISQSRIGADLDSTPYSVIIRPGVQGLADIQDVTGGFIRDTTAGGVYLELPPSRAAKVVSRGYTDMVPVTGEVAVPKPRNREQAFGVINSVEAQLRVFAPKAATAETTIFNLTGTFPVLVGFNDTECLEFDTGGLVGDLAMLSFSYTLSYGGAQSPPQTGADFTWNPAIAGENLTVIIQHASVIHDGTSISFCFTHAGSNDAESVDVDIIISITLNNPHSLAFETLTRSAFDFDARSQKRYGTRPRTQPVTFGAYRATPLPADFTISAAARAALELAAKRELEQFAKPVQVYAIDHDFSRDILARRISDKEHLRLSDGTNSAWFVEAMETDIIIPPQLLQTVYYSNQTRMAL